MRSASRSDFVLDDWILRQNKPVIISSYTAHRNCEVWNTGTKNDSHSLDEFWAERFLTYPTNSRGGSTKQSKTSQSNESASVASTDSTTVRDSNILSDGQFSLDGLAESWIPYDEGQRICSGRNFAKQETLLALAFLVTVFDFELAVPTEWKPQPDLRRFGGETMSPKDLIPCKLRRRDWRTFNREAA